MNNNESKKEKRGLFVALGICLVAIGIAAWGTYNSVADYVNMTEGTEISDQDLDPLPNKEQEVGTDETGDTMTESSKEDEVSVNPTEKPVENNEQSANESQEESSAVETDSKTYTLLDSYILPVDSINIINPYSDGLVYNETMKDYRAHKAVDLSAKEGETVYAVNNGLVKKCFNDLLLGNVVVVEHGEYELWYCGLGATFLVSEGEIISQGTAIGSVKEVPFEKGETHIHLEVKKDGKSVDPFSLNLF